MNLNLNFNICSKSNRLYSTIVKRKKSRIRPELIQKARNSEDDKYVRINGNTLRDGHQSLIGGQHRIQHLEEAAKLIDRIRSPKLQFPGVEEIGGGTTVDFPLRYKGENPFENIRKISANMPNTPTMCLTRSDSIVGYSTNPKDVVESFVRLYFEAGIDVFRNFDAYNNVQNHFNIAEAVHKVGGHYQGAITFTTHEDPTLYNVKQVAQMAKALKELGAHSLAIKDMAGISTPAMMRAWVTEIKNAVPELPLIVHSHYTTGFAPITYLNAVEAGADAIDCAVSSLSGRTGHPAIEVMSRILTDLGYDTGIDNKALAQCAEYYRSIDPLYKKFEANMSGSVDFRVFEKGIPGGQISIFKNELERNQLGHLFDAIMVSIQECRNDVGGVPLVTPTADNVARQTLINAIAKEEDRQPYMTFWMGYNEMLRGALGQPKQPMNSTLQKRALRQHCKAFIKQMVIDGELDQKTADLFNDEVITSLQLALWEVSRPVRDRLRLKEIEARIEQLGSLSESQREEMDAKIRSLKTSFNLGSDFEQTLEMLRAEASSIKNGLKDSTKQEDISDYDYVSLLKQDPPEHLQTKIWSNKKELAVLVDKLSDVQMAKIMCSAAFITVAPSTVLPPSMPNYRREVEMLAQKHKFKLPPEDSDEFEEYAVLYAIFKGNQDIALNFFKNFGKDNDFQPPVPGTKKPEHVAIKAEIEPKMYPFVTKNQDSIGDEYVPDWSDPQIETVMKKELDMLADNSRQIKNLQLKKEKTQSKIRKDIIDEEIGDLTNQAKTIRDNVRYRFRKANVCIKPVGYSVDVDGSLDAMMQKFENLLTNGKFGRQFREKVPREKL